MSDIHDGIENAFTYHPPKGDQPQRYEAIRNKAKELANLIADTSPNSGERDIALMLVSAAVMFANGAIARHE